MLWRARKSLVKALEPSSWAAPCVGPKQRSPRRGSDRPRRRPAALPGRRWSARRRCRCEIRQPLRSPSRRWRRSRRSGSRAVPALPGATNTVSTRGDLRHFPGQRVLAPAAADDQDVHCSCSSRVQCLKWRMPVNTIAMPCSSAAAITSSSRIEPPGWITAVMPACGGVVDAVAEREEGIRGHHRARDREARMLGLDRGDARGVDAAHLAGADTDGAAVAA